MAILTIDPNLDRYCIYGWCLVGKKQICPFCREKVGSSYKRSFSQKEILFSLSSIF